MNARLALFTVVPLVALAPPLSNAQSAPDQRLMDQLREAQDYALRAGQDLAHSLAALQQAIPRFGMPYVDGQGNIVIPRVHPPPRGMPIPDAPPNPL